MIAVYVAIARESYAAEGTETFDYWFDLLVGVMFFIGAGTALAGLTLVWVSRIRRRQS